jgi:hypothetical protein
VKLAYHSRTLRLLGVEPRLSPRAVAAVERTEALRGMRLPAAVRELYTLDGVAAGLARANWCRRRGAARRVPPAVAGGRGRAPGG